MDDEGEYSEFWNRKDEASGSGEDISDSDGINPLNVLDALALFQSRCIIFGCIYYVYGGVEFEYLLYQCIFLISFFLNCQMILRLSKA